MIASKVFRSSEYSFLVLPQDLPLYLYRDLISDRKHFFFKFFYGKIQFLGSPCNSIIPLLYGHKYLCFTTFCKTLFKTFRKSFLLAFLPENIFIFLFIKFRKTHITHLFTALYRLRAFSLFSPNSFRNTVSLYFLFT